MQISIKNIEKSYSNSTGTVRREVLKTLSLEVATAEKIAIMGPSGSGKTTLLNIIGTLDKPDSGEIQIGEKRLSEMTAEEIPAFRNQTIGFVFQFHHLLPQLSLRENVLLPTLPKKGNKQELYARADELIKLMGIWEQRNNRPEELSGGECQRAAVARALINSPKILLADEPGGSLDAKNADIMMNLLCDINKKMQLSLIVVTHALDIAKKMDTIYNLHEGQIQVWNPIG